MIKVEFDFGSGFQEYEATTKDFIRNERLHSRLKSADNSCRFSLVPDLALLTLLRDATTDIPVKITENNQPYFFGYLRKTFNIKKTQKLQPIQIEIVNPSFFLKKKIDTPYNLIGYKVCDTTNTESSVVHRILNDSGFISFDLIDIDVVLPIFSTRENDTYYDVLATLLYEYGYLFDFDEEGVFKLYEIFPDDVTTTNQFDGSNCLDEIVQTKKEDSVDKVTVKFREVETINNAIAFTDATDAGQGNKCNIEVMPNSYFGAGEGHDSWFAEYGIEGKEVLAVVGATLDIVKDSDIVVEEFIPYNTRALLKIKNTNSTFSRWIRKLDIRGNAIVVKAESFSIVEEGTENPETIETKYIFHKDHADRLASGMMWYHEYSDFNYRVKSKTDYALGDFAIVTDYGLGTVTTRIIEKKTLANNVHEYILEAVNEYSPVSTTGFTNRRSDAQNQQISTVVESALLGLNPDGTLAQPIDSNTMVVDIEPSGDGLYFTKSFLGLFKDEDRRSYIDIDGNFEFNKDDSFLRSTETGIKVKGDIEATAGIIAGWIIANTGLKSRDTGARIELNRDKNRISVFSSSQEVTSMGYLEGLPKSDGTGNWGAGDRGFWTAPGDQLVIDGNIEYTAGDWKIDHDASLIIKNASETETVLRLGSISGENGLFILENNTGNDFRGKFTSNEFFVGNDLSHIAYDAIAQELVMQLVTFRVTSLDTSVKGSLNISSEGNIETLTRPISITTATDGIASGKGQITHSLKIEMNSPDVEIKGDLKIDGGVSAGDGVMTIQGQPGTLETDTVNGSLHVNGTMSASSGVDVITSRTTFRNFHAGGSGGWMPGYTLQRGSGDIYALYASGEHLAIQTRDGNGDNPSIIMRMNNDEVEFYKPVMGIVDYGSNTNGEYVRFEDGFQVCWSNDFFLDHTGGNSGASRLSGIWTFPASFAVRSAEFMNIPAQNADRWDGCSRLNVISWGSTTSVVGSTTFTIHFTSGTVNTDYALVSRISVCAIGRWK